MKIGKKLSSIILALVICAALVGTTWAVAANTYTATLSDAVFCEEELKTSKTVTLTVKAGAKVAMDALQMQVKVPDGWKITGIANDELKFTGKNYNNDEKTRDEGYYGLITWYTFDEDAGNVTTDLLATVTVKVPAGTAVGEYKIDCEIVDISHNFGTSWEDGQTISTTLTVGKHTDGKNDGDHLCDYCNGAVEGASCDDANNDGDHKCDECGAENVTVCGDSGKDHICDTDSKCTAYSVGNNAHADTNKDHNCDYGCTEPIGKHEDGDADHNCDYCGDKVPCSDADNDGDHKCDKCDAIVSECGDEGKDHICDTDSACTVYSTGNNAHADGEDKDHLCDYGCGKTADDGCHDATDDGDHKCDECEDTADVTVCGDSDKNHICDTDSACTAYSTGDNAHKDGATVDNKCEYCGGDVACDVCTRLTAIDAKAATCQETGYLAYWQCACGKYYSDATAEKEIADLTAWMAEGGDGYVGKNAGNHTGDKVTYTHNDETHSATYDCCGGAFVTDEAHDFTNGNCVCGAEKPVAPVTNINVVSKGVTNYTANGNVVTVTHSAACKVGYLKDGKYVAIAAVANGDGSYSFTAPEGVAEVLLVVKGDVTGDGKCIIADRGKIAKHTLKKSHDSYAALTEEWMIFAADINNNGSVDISDRGKIAKNTLRTSHESYVALTW